MSKKNSKGERSVIMKDKYISESGLQGGKAIAEHITLGSYIIGFPFLIMGVIAIIAIVFNLGFPTNAAVIIGVLLVTIIGLLLVIGGYSISQTKKNRKKSLATKE